MQKASLLFRRRRGLGARGDRRPGAGIPHGDAPPSRPTPVTEANRFSWRSTWRAKTSAPRTSSRAWPSPPRSAGSPFMVGEGGVDGTVICDGDSDPHGNGLPVPGIEVPREGPLSRPTPPSSVSST